MVPENELDNKGGGEKKPCTEITIKWFCANHKCAMKKSFGQSINSSSLRLPA